MIKNLVFDFGGVVLDINWQAAVEAFAALGLPGAEQAIDRYKQKGLFLDLEEGRADASAFTAKLSEMAGRNLSYEEVETAWRAFFYEPPKARLELLEKLKCSHRMFLLSNTNPFVMGWACSERFTSAGKPLDHYFDAMFRSYELGKSKPSKEIFQIMIDAAPLDPAETLFIDDGRENIECAAALGFKTLHAGEGVDWEDTLKTLFHEGETS